MQLYYASSSLQKTTSPPGSLLAPETLSWVLRQFTFWSQNFHPGTTIQKNMSPYGSLCSILLRPLIWISIFHLEQLQSSFWLFFLLLCSIKVFSIPPAITPSLNKKWRLNLSHVQQFCAYCTYEGETGTGKCVEELAQKKTLKVPSPYLSSDRNPHYLCFLNYQKFIALSNKLLPLNPHGYTLQSWL